MAVMPLKGSGGCPRPSGLDHAATGAPRGRKARGDSRLRVLRALVLVWMWVGAAQASPSEALPGRPFVLSFPDLPAGEIVWETAPLTALSLPAQGEGLVLAVLEAPLSVPPGTYPVCARVGGVRRCQEVRLVPLVRWEAEVPREAGDELRVTLRNLGNVPLPYVLAPYKSETVSFARREGTLGPGETTRVSLPLRGSGLLLVRLRISGEERFYAVRVEGPGEAPAYRLRGRAEVSWTSGGGAGALSLGGRLSQEVEASLLVRSALDRTAASVYVRTRAWELGATTAPSLRLSYQEGPFRISAAYPPALQVSWRQGGEGWSFSVDTHRVRAGYANSGVAVDLGYDGAPSLRLQHLGSPRLYAEVDRELRLGGMLPGWSVEATLLGNNAVRITHFGFLEGISYQLSGQVRPAEEAWKWDVTGALAWRLGLASFSLAGNLGERNWLRMGLRVRDEPWDFWFQGRWDGTGPSLSGTLSWSEAPWRLSLSGGVGSKGDLRLALAGAWSFEMPVPPGISEALGGLDGPLVEGWVELEGRPLPGALVRAGNRQVLTDATGRFRLYVPPGEGHLRVFPPPGTPALPAKTSLTPGEGGLRIRLEALAVLRAACSEGGKGARLQGPASGYVACGEEVFLPPGRYRVFPEPLDGYAAPEMEELDLAPLQTTTLRLTFPPRPLVAVEPPTQLDLELPPAAAPGEEVTVSLRAPGESFLLRLRKGAEVLNVLQGKADGTPLTFQVPWEAREDLTLEFFGEGWKTEKTLRVLQGEVPMRINLHPLRPAPGDRLRVEVVPRFPATGAWIRVGQREEAMERGEGGTFFALVSLDEALLESATEVFPGVWALDMEVEVRQGEQGVSRTLRVFLSSGPR